MYTLDAESAKQSDTRGNRIDDTGPYVVTIVHGVEIPANANGTKGVGFKVRTETGQDAYLPLYTHNGKNEPLPSFRTLNALMTCAKVRTLTPTEGIIQKWDKDKKAEVEIAAKVYPEISGKKVGVFIEMENNVYLGKKQRRPVLVGAFEPETLFTAKEILGKATKAETYAKLVATLRDRESGQSKSISLHGTAPKAIEFDDDIPF